LHAFKAEQSIEQVLKNRRYNPSFFSTVTSSYSMSCTKKTGAYKTELHIEEELNNVLFRHDIGLSYAAQLSRGLILRTIGKQLLATTGPVQMQSRSKPAGISPAA